MPPARHHTWVWASTRIGGRAGSRSALRSGAWRGARRASGYPLCREAVDVLLGSWKAVHLTLPERKDRAGAREPDHLAAGQCVSPRPIETAFGHEPVPAVATLRLDLWATPAKPLT